MYRVEQVQTSESSEELQDEGSDIFQPRSSRNARGGRALPAHLQGGVKQADQDERLGGTGVIDTYRPGFLRHGRGAVLQDPWPS